MATKAAAGGVCLRQKKKKPRTRSGRSFLLLYSSSFLIDTSIPKSVSSAGLGLCARLCQALRAIPPDLSARHRDFHVEIPRNLLLQLLVKRALKLADLPAAQARHVNVVPRPMRLVVVAVAAQMQQVQLIDQS